MLYCHPGCPHIVVVSSMGPESSSPKPTLVSLLIRVASLVVHNFDTYSMSDPALMALQPLKLQPAGTQLVVVDMPIISFLLFFDHGAEYQAADLDTLPPLTAAYGVPFWGACPLS